MRSTTSSQSFQVLDFIVIVLRHGQKTVGNVLSDEQKLTIYCLLVRRQPAHHRQISPARIRRKWWPGTESNCRHRDF